MASYQARQRDPLLDQNTQAALERRGKELLGAVLVVLGVLTAMLLGSYAPDDPSWMAVSSAPVHNWLGRIGAGIASPMIVIVGKGAWLVPAGLAVWGMRFILHIGEERLSGRIVFFPIAVAVASVFSALLVPGAEWRQAYGLGGHFGDMIAGSLLGISPVSGSFGLTLMSVVLFFAMIAMALFVLGFEKTELGTMARVAALSAATLYDRAMNALGTGAMASVQAARQAAEHARQRRAEAARQAAELAAWEQQQAELQQRDWSVEDGYAPQPARSASRVRRAPEPMSDAYDAPRAELIEPQWDNVFEDDDTPAPSPERIRARIARAVQTRAEAVPPAAPAMQDSYYAEPRAPLRAEPRDSRAAAAPVAPTASPVAPAPAPVTAPAPATPASVLAAVAARLSRGARAAAAPAPVAPPLRRAEPPLQAQPRYMPGLSAHPGFSAPRPAAPPRPAEPVRPRMPEPPVMAPEPAPEADLYEAPGDIAPAEAGWTAPSRREVVAAPEEDDFDRNAFATLDEDDDDDDAIPPLPAHAGLIRQASPAATPERRVMTAPRKAPAPSRQAVAEAQPRLGLEASGHPAYETPPLSLLANPTTIERHMLSDEALEENARMLESVLEDYGVKGEIVSVRPGPVVTMYELEPAPGLKASRVIGLADDIARSMSALSARVSTVPGRSVIGIELPNVHREKVLLREILASRDFGDSNMRLPLALGKDIGGAPVIANLSKMPHLLIAGTTGSGKSVAINTMILSLLYKLSPEECRLIMVDPKMLELSVYDGIPHLLSPVVTDPKKAVVALKWVVGEMEERYRKMSKMGVRNIEGYNGRVREALSKNEMFKRTVQTGFDEETGEPVFETEEFQPQAFPYIVVIVDEMADLMMVAGKEIEACIQRLAQMARASGIHLIMATQRPSVDVITGTIKANFPTRISFQVTSKIDSRTILGEQGAEQLLGMGDMLYMGTGSRITRIHGPFVSDEEVEEIVNHLKSFGPPEYMSGVVEGPDEEMASDIDQVLGLGGNSEGEDALYDQAVAIVARDRKCSTSYIQRKLGIGYNKAARLVEQMEDEGVVSPANHVGKREILVPEA